MSKKWLIKTFLRRQENWESKPVANGFTLSEMLLSLLLGLLISSFLAWQGKVMLQALALPRDDQEQFSVLQIRELVSLSQRAHVQNGKLYLTYQGKEEILEQDKNRLVKKPGYEIFLEDIEEVHFEQNQIIELVWTKKAKSKRFQVG